MTARFVPAALAVLAAVSAWLTLGTQAVLDQGTSARIGVLPPWWVLLGLLAALAGTTLVRRLPAERLWPLALSVVLWLPWLPGPVPPAFLIWQGPMASLVWALIGLGLAAPWLAVLGRAPLATNPRAAPWLLAIIVAVSGAGGAWWLGNRLPAGDEPHYLIIADSLLRDGDLSIENNHQRGDFTTYHDGELRPDYLQRGQDGEIYSIHPPGVSVLLLPAFAIAGWPGAVAFMVAVAALAAGLLWLTAWRLTGSAGAAWMASAAVAFSAPGYFHSFAIYPDGTGALCTVTGLWALVQAEQGQKFSRSQLMLIGAALAFLPWLHTRFALTAGVLGVALLLRIPPGANRLRDRSALLAIPVVAALAWFGFFWAIWGTPNPAAPYGSYTQSAWRHLWPGVPGLLFDQQFGVIANAPIYAIALVALAPLARQRPRLALEVVAVVVPYLLAVASYRMWWGGLSAPGRFLVSVLPALALPLAVAWRDGRAAQRAMMLLLLAVGMVMVAARTLVDHGGLLYNSRDGYDLLLDRANRGVSLPLAWPSLHRDVVADALLDIGKWLIVSTAGCLACVWAVRRTRHAWVCSAAAFTCVLMAAASLVWSGPAEANTPQASAIAMLERWPDFAVGVGWQSRPYRFSAKAAFPEQLELASATRGAATTGRPPMFTARLVPGGHYEVIVQGDRPRGMLTLGAGRTANPLDTWRLDGRAGGPTGILLTLPLQIDSLTLTGDEAAQLSAGRVTLRPRVAGNLTGAPRRVARQASRYGALRVFFLDDNAYVEPNGFWTRGRSNTDLFVDAAPPGLATDAVAPAALRIRAGAVATTVVVSSGDWRMALDLDPGAATDLPLPDRNGAGWSIRVAAGNGFRPAQHDQASRDWRHLGVWVEPPP